MSETSVPQTRPLQLLGISGSLRRNSFNSAILQAMQRQSLGSTAMLQLFPLHHVPLFNQDVEDEGAPQVIQELRAVVQRSDAVIFASPEYNQGMSGVLKNALDWLSRPHGRSALKGKPVLTLTSSPSLLGGARANAQLRETLAALGARIVLHPPLALARVQEKLRGGMLVHEESLDAIAGALQILQAELRSLDGSAG
jgi:chromate reductase